MRKLILATASVLALGLAASGPSFAQQPNSSAQIPGANPSSATMPATNGAASGDMMQQGQQGTQSTAPVRLSRSQVRQVQQQLKTAGLYKGRIDGKMGPETRRAVAQFQKQNGMQGSGRIDQQTMAALSSGGNGTNGAGSSAMPNTQPGNAGTPDNSGLNGTGNPGPSGTGATQPGASGNLNPTPTPNQH